MRRSRLRRLARGEYQSAGRCVGDGKGARSCGGAYRASAAGGAGFGDRDHCVAAGKIDRKIAIGDHPAHGGFGNRARQSAGSGSECGRYASVLIDSGRHQVAGELKTHDVALTGGHHSIVRKS